MTTLTNARLYLRARMGLHSTDQLAQDTELTYALNEGLHAYSSELDWWWLEDQTSFTTTAGTATYALPADHKITKQLWIGDELLAPRQYQDLIRLSEDSSATPAYYAIKDSLIYLSPKPANSTTTVYHYYVRQETALSSGSDTPLIPTRYDGLWLSHAAVIMADRMDNPQKRMIHERARDEWLKRARDEARAHRGLVPVKARRDTSWG